MFKHVFDEYEYNPQADQPSQSSDNSEQIQPPRPDGAEGEDLSTAFEIPLNTLMDCLNIFGTAGTLPGSSTKKKKKDADDDDGGGAFGGGRKDKGKGRADANADNSRLDQWFAPAKGTTGLRMLYDGRGYPLTLLVYVNLSSCCCCCRVSVCCDGADMDTAYFCLYGLLQDRGGGWAHGDL